MVEQEQRNTQERMNEGDVANAVHTVEVIKEREQTFRDICKRLDEVREEARAGLSEDQPSGLGTLIDEASDPSYIQYVHGLRKVVGNQIELALKGQPYDTDALDQMLPFLENDHVHAVNYYKSLTERTSSEKDQ